ncbi:MAG: 50S ribosomal protein L9 [Oceanococcus sp.]|nr:MAG: 50S ribosomal protein L9 [Oceanococcus sp.]
MEVILLERIRNLGDLGDKVKVKPGFGRNFLIPQGKALPATEANMAVFEARKAELIKQAEDSLNAAKLRAHGCEGVELSIVAMASEEGKLYGSIHAAQIAEAAQERGIDLNASEISTDDVIRQVGEYEVTLNFHADVQTRIKLVVEAQKAA